LDAEPGFLLTELGRVDKCFGPQLAELWRTTFEQAYRAEHHEDDIRAYCESNFSVDAAEAALCDPRIICKVAFRDKTAVGFYLVKHNDCPVPLGGSSSELKQIYVLASDYGSGVGKFMFDDAIQCIQDSGRSWVWLVVSDRNQRAQAFYRKLAFKPLGIGPVIEIGTDPLTSTIMGREIQRPN